MQGLIVITKDPRGLMPMQSALVREGYRVAISAADEDSLLESVGELTPEVVIVDCRADACAVATARRLLATECNLKELLAIAYLRKDQAAEIDWSGIDDFITDPFDPEELVARLSLLFWRSRKINSDQVIKIEGLIVDMANYEVTIDGTPVELTFKEYELLKFLATRRGRVFTREALLDHVWGYDYYGGTRTVDVHVRRLRAKLTPSCDALIETVRNVGYRFSA